MDIEIQKSTIGLIIRRGPGSGSSSSFWGDTEIEKDLPDRGASITFGRGHVMPGGEFYLSIHFGYTSPSMKQYYRSLSLNLQQINELIEYLHECVKNPSRTL